MKEFGQKNQKIFAAIICHNDELSLSSLDLIEVFLSDLQKSAKSFSKSILFPFS